MITEIENQFLLKVLFRYKRIFFETNSNSHFKLLAIACVKNIQKLIVLFHEFKMKSFLHKCWNTVSCLKVFTKWLGLTLNYFFKQFFTALKLVIIEQCFPTSAPQGLRWVKYLEFNLVKGMIISQSKPFLLSE